MLVNVMERSLAVNFSSFHFMATLPGTLFLLSAIQWGHEIIEILTPQSLEIRGSLSKKWYPEK